jgi:hypothetical protein
MGTEKLAYYAGIGCIVPAIALIVLFISII